MEEQSSMSPPIMEVKKGSTLFGKGLAYWILLIMSILANLVGGDAALLLGRLYFVHGGSQRWLYTCLESGGWPIMLLPLAISHCFTTRTHNPNASQLYSQHQHRLSITKNYKLKLLLCSTVIGLLLGIDNLLFSWGLSYLPVSTNSLLYSTQLPFNVLFTYMLVGQKLSAYILNAVVIITTGAVLLGIQSSSDKPGGTTSKQYILGFVATIAASALYGFLLPLTELAYKMLGTNNMRMVLELQVGSSIAATAFAVVGMWAGGTFQALKHEAMQFDLGRTAYWLTVVWSAICWQVFNMGTFGIIFLTSSLMTCVFMTATLPTVPVLAVIFFHDSFSAIKAAATFLSIWGFLSYIYDGYLASKRTPIDQSEHPLEILESEHPLEVQVSVTSNPTIEVHN